MIKRRRLGTVYTKSPAQNVEKWLIDNFTKLLFSIFISIMWMGILYVLIGVVNFLGSQMGELWEKDLPVSTIYNHPVALPVKIIGILFIFWYVFRAKTNRRG